MRSSLHLLITFLTIFALSSCSRTPSWLKGTWELDAKATVDAALKADGENKATINGDKQPKGFEQALGNLANNLAHSLGEALAPALLASEYDHATLTITDSEVIIMKNCKGKALTYKVLDTTADSVILKTSDDKITTWYRRDAMIATRVSADLKAELLFRRLK